MKIIGIKFFLNWNKKFLTTFVFYIKKSIKRERSNILTGGLNGT